MLAQMQNTVTDYSQGGAGAGWYEYSRRPPQGTARTDEGDIHATDFKLKSIDNTAFYRLSVFEIVIYETQCYTASNPHVYEYLMMSYTVEYDHVYETRERAIGMRRS